MAVVSRGRRVGRPATLAWLVLIGLTPAACSPLASDPPTAVDIAPMAWTWPNGDPAPGPVVAEAIATQLGVPYDSLEAGVFRLDHPARNVATVWVFRVIGLTSDTLLDRWVNGVDASRCPDVPQPGRLANHDATIVRVKVGDLCAPEYVVRLDDPTLAVIIDDGGYAGNAPDAPPVVPFRPVIEIEPIVPWLLDQLVTTDLKGGGPGGQNNP